MRKMLVSAAYRIAFAYACGFALAILVLGVIVYFAADANIRQQQDSAIAAESAMLMREYRGDGIADLREEIAEREVGSSINSFGYALFDASGHRIAGSLDTPRPEPGWRQIVFLDPREGPDPARALVRELKDGSRLVVAVDSEAVERIDATILALFGGAFVLVILIGIAGALLLGRYLRGRLARITGTARAIVAGDLDRRMPVGPDGDEFDELARALNAMLDRIAVLLENLRQVSSDIAHDLRSPLSRLRGRMEAALAKPERDGAHRQALEEAIERSDQLLSLFSAILRISEVESGALAATFTDIDLSNLVSDLGETFAPAIADEGRIFQADVEPYIHIHGDRELLAQAVVNLLDNAQRHTPTGSSIDLRLVRGDDAILLSVGDNGPGVAAADRDRIVRRFARLESSRSTPGHGLGLNMVMAIASVHGAELRIDDNAPGLRATLVFSGKGE